MLSFDIHLPQIRPSSILSNAKVHSQVFVHNVTYTDCRRNFHKVRSQSPIKSTWSVFFYNVFNYWNHCISPACSAGARWKEKTFHINVTKKEWFKIIWLNMSLLMSVTKPHGIASGVYLGLCYEATGSSTALDGTLVHRWLLSKSSSFPDSSRYRCILLGWRTSRGECQENDPRQVPAQGPVV